MKLSKPIHKSRLLAFKDEKILVLEKVGLKKRYTLAGGVQKKNETDCHSLIREAEEEIGVLFNKNELHYFISRCTKIKSKAKDKREVCKHYFVTTKNITSVELLEPEKFKNILWVPWYQALEYLDKEDRSAVTIYCDEYRQEAN